MIVERVITIEYLDPSMGELLLSKFPDESGFDFDYTQSGIWSPLLPRGHSRMIDVSPMEIRRKLLLDDDDEEVEKFRKVGSKIKRKMSMAMSSSSSSNNKKRKKSSNKGWVKLLKAAASKSFKKHKVAPSLSLHNFLNLG